MILAKQERKTMDNLTPSPPQKKKRRKGQSYYCSRFVAVGYYSCLAPRHDWGQLNFGGKLLALYV